MSCPRLPHDHQHPSGKDRECWMLFCFTEARACNTSKVKWKGITSERPSLATCKSYWLWHWKPSTKILLVEGPPSFWKILISYTCEIHNQEIQALCFGTSLLPEKFSLGCTGHSAQEVKTGKFCLATKGSYPKSHRSKLWSTDSGFAPSLWDN